MVRIGQNDFLFDDREAADYTVRGNLRLFYALWEAGYITAVVYEGVNYFQRDVLDQFINRDDSTDIIQEYLDGQ